MPKLNMEGPFPLTKEAIDANVEETIGNYALGTIENIKTNNTSQNIFYVQYVGRSDNINRRLKEHIEEKYTYFRFTHSASLIAAYKKECRDYHAFGAEELDNIIHPAKPENAPADLRCPVCGQ
jgi:hypothetical protein